jgi:hypothetical protein
MDCVDCHNRPTHIYNPPDRSVNEAFVAGRLDASLPYLKQQAVEALSKQYSSTEEAAAGIDTHLEEYYRGSYPDVHAGKRESIRAAIAQVQRIYRSNFFPEMKVDWTTHVDNVGHSYSLGCFRCHDGQHKTKTGKTIRADCNICHTVLDQMDGGTPITVKDGAFQHPVDLGDMSGMKCSDCHTGKGLGQ